jgi:hypothetical protein
MDVKFFSVREIQPLIDEFEALQVLWVLQAATAYQPLLIKTTIDNFTCFVMNKRVICVKVILSRQRLPKFVQLFLWSFSCFTTIEKTV